jgi:N-acyl-D-amino-acid deacylase
LIVAKAIIKPESGCIAKSVLKLSTAGVIVLILSIQGVTLAQEARISDAIGVTGIPAPGMESFDRVMTDLMIKWRIPGAALAVAKDGHLVLAHGYGFADRELDQVTQPDSLFRIGSISKPITAVAILKLVEDGLLDLDSKVFRILDQFGQQSGTSVSNITVRQLLQHSGGWDPSRNFDPMFMPYTVKAATEVGVKPPADCETVIRFMLKRSLDFQPGTSYAYSNFGYCILGRVIEKVTGQHYQDYVSRNVLAPMGITRMRLGGTMLEDRAAGEVKYYDAANRTGPSVFFPHREVPIQYGGWYLEALDSLAGWIASPIDLLRFLTAVDGSRSPSFLDKQTVRLMVSRPSPPLWVGTPTYYALGWLVRPVGEDSNWWHAGSIPGTYGLLVRRYDGLAWAVLFNTRPLDEEGFGLEVDVGLHDAASEVTRWPDHNLFSQSEGLVEKPVMQMFSAGVGNFRSNVGILTNSLITEFKFSQANREIQFDVRGRAGVVGFAEIHAPLELLSGQFSVQVDGRDRQFERTSNLTHTVIRVEYPHDSRTITVKVISAAVDFEMLLSLAAVLAAAAIPLLYLVLRIRTGVASPRKQKFD